MADLIDRQELLEHKGCCRARIIQMIESAPTVDAVPVVRCKDCRFRQGEKEGFCYGIERYVSDADYCSRGERRADEMR